MKEKHSEAINQELTQAPPHWLEWAREIQAISQTGYHFSENDYQRERYVRLTEIAAEMISAQSRMDHRYLMDIFNMQAGYATPKVDVRGAVFRNGMLLMVKERQDGGWTMPGGWADVGDVPSQAVEREVWEEAGFHVKAHKLVGLYDANRTGPLELFHAYKVVFLCDIIDGEPTPSDETSEVAFYGKDEIPAVLSGERTKVRHILDAFNALIHPDSPTVFD